MTVLSDQWAMASTMRLWVGSAGSTVYGTTPPGQRNWLPLMATAKAIGPPSATGVSSSTLPRTMSPSKIARSPTTW